jgi:hypothetical protein
LDVDIKLITDVAHFTEDLGADRLARLELTMLIEAGVDQIEVADDLIRLIDHG